MRRLRLIKVVVPEIDAYFGSTAESMEPEYRCSECGCRRWISMQIRRILSMMGQLRG